MHISATPPILYYVQTVVDIVNVPSRVVQSVVELYKWGGDATEHCTPGCHPCV